MWPFKPVEILLCPNPECNHFFNEHDRGCKHKDYPHGEHKDMYTGLWYPGQPQYCSCQISHYELGYHFAKEKFIKNPKNKDKIFKDYKTKYQDEPGIDYE